MRGVIAAVLLCLGSVPAFAAQADFSGRWIFNPSKSKNIGMMSQMMMSQNAKQSSAALDVTSYTTFQGNQQQTKAHYDLTGKAVINDSPMAGPSQTVSKWDGQKLVTTWTSKGAVKGTKTVRIETRSVSADGKTMTVESAHGPNPPVVMVFDKK